MKKIAFLLCILTVFFAVIQASEKPVVLLAYEKTRFKNRLISAMQDILENEGYAVESIDHSKGALDNIDTSLYAVIFITNSGVNSMVRPWVSSWIENADPETKILLHTTQRDNWEVITTVDAVTSASSTRNVESFAKEYTERIMKLAEKEMDE